ncbi:MAG: hypothetical protein QM817_28605 [Archangium sp.]
MKLAQLLAAPDDLSLRQVYADQLIEAGDARGTFIAHQIAQERLDTLDERYAPMIASSRRLELKHRGEWLAPILKKLKVKNVKDVRPVFRGGFLHRLALSPEQVKHFPFIAEHEPLAGIELVVNEHLPEEFRELKEPKAFRVLKVTPEGWFTANSAGNVLAWGMPLLRELDLTGADLGPVGGTMVASEPTGLGDTFEDFVEPPPFAKGQLTSVVMHGCMLGEVGVLALLNATHLTALRELDIGGCVLSEQDTLKAFAKAKSLHGLERLGLAGNRIDPHGLAGWAGLPRLRALMLPQSTSAATLAKLFPKPSPKLRELDVRSARELMKSPRAVLDAAEAFTNLHVGTTSLGDAGWKQLLDAPSTRTLFHLQANGCSLSDEAIDALVDSKLKRLVTLDVSSNKLNDPALARLMKWEGSELLTHLRISNNRKLTMKGYQALIDAKHFQPALLEVGKVSDAKAKKALEERFGDALAH